MGFGPGRIYAGRSHLSLSCTPLPTIRPPWAASEIPVADWGALRPPGGIAIPIPDAPTESPVAGGSMAIGFCSASMHSAYPAAPASLGPVVHCAHHPPARRAGRKCLLASSAQRRMLADMQPMIWWHIMGSVASTLHDELRQF